MGLWALDKSKGLPKIECPEPLPKGKLTVEQVQEYVMYEGLGFCIYEYIEPRKIQDAKLVKLWKEAQQAMQKIQEYIYEDSNTSGV